LPPDVKILKLKCTKFEYSIATGAPPHRLSWGAYSTRPDPLAGFKGPTSKRREREEKKGGWLSPQSQIPGYVTPAEKEVTIL